jgi:hypothetical protein
MAKKAKYLLETADGWKALLYAIQGRKVSLTQSRRFHIDVTRKREGVWNLK